MASKTDSVATPEEPQSGPTIAPQRYRIDPSWYERQGRSFAYFARERMCKESQARFGEPVTMRVPVKGPTGKRVAFEKRTLAYGDDPVAVIQECCAKTPLYGDPRLGLKEALFRIFLAGGNQPLTLQELCERVTDWVGIGDGRIINSSIIRRLLEQDDYYGFEPVG